ncbi:RNA-guided pseudouridylation complex pseudouridine synthase subunit Cbf5 [Candidatus Woesearchaeota archaeon]|nr:RNA-guided pseudouridylation complex pseudouridine synthase subunit Cbf5 [Candidatus Woesearchaeota archaeon]
MPKLPFEIIEREILTKRPCKTNPDYGLDPYKRPVNKLIEYGVVNINKPSGPTSHIVADHVKKILNLKKAGHSGTLDPGVTGVLPIALDRATRVTQVLLPAGKEYVAIMHLHKKVDEKLLKKVLKEFIGKIEQLPPIKSAVRRILRKRTIYYLEVMEIEEQDILFRVGCQAGTYIRKLCHDIGRKLNTGAHMAQLIRTKAGPFSDKDMVYLQDLKDAFWYFKNENKELPLRKIIYPIEFAINHISKVWINDLAVDTVCHGADLKIPGVCRLHDDIKKDDIVVIMTLKDELVAFGKAKLSSEEIILADKGLAVKTTKVFMEPGVYPKFEVKKTG